MTVQNWIVAFLLALLFLAVLSAVGLWAEYANADPKVGGHCAAGCRPMRAVLVNRPVYPIHSFERAFVICEWPELSR